MCGILHLSGVGRLSYRAFAGPYYVRRAMSRRKSTASTAYSEMKDAAKLIANGRPVDIGQADDGDDVERKQDHLHDKARHHHRRQGRRALPGDPFDEQPCAGHGCERTEHPEEDRRERVRGWPARRAPQTTSARDCHSHHRHHGRQTAFAN